MTTSLRQPLLPAAVNAVPRPEVYEEALIDSGGAPVVLSIWHAPEPLATVVFLPGTMVHPLFYANFLDRLAGEGFTVVGVHSQGHGKSPRTGAPLTFAALVRNARDAVSYAVGLGRPVVVMGSSQGGMLAMAVAVADGRIAGVVAHNILDPGVPEALHATRFPAWLAVAHRPLRRVLRIAGRLLPWLPVPITLYLDLHKVCREEWTLEQFLTDPLALHRYRCGSSPACSPRTCPACSTAVSDAQLSCSRPTATRCSASRTHGGCTNAWLPRRRSSSCSTSTAT